MNFGRGERIAYMTEFNIFWSMGSGRSGG